MAQDGGLLQKAGMPGKMVRYGDPGSEFDENHFDDATEPPEDEADEGEYLLPSRELSPIEEEVKVGISRLTKRMGKPGR